VPHAASGIAYSTVKIRTDREQTLQTERNRLRAVAAALDTGTLAMLSDAVGSAVAGVNEIESGGGLAATADDVLARWRHPTRGVISPSSFIPLAEETGLMIPPGEWVVREACRHAAAGRPVTALRSGSPSTGRRLNSAIRISSA
jgi:predicted signal transduction protein with EAL and GGDEF domain